MSVGMAAESHLAGKFNKDQFNIVDRYICTSVRW
ncbi:hypothetical protein [Staphylococcus epidermidis]